MFSKVKNIIILEHLKRTNETNLFKLRSLPVFILQYSKHLLFGRWIDNLTKSTRQKTDTQPMKEEFEKKDKKDEPK